MEKEFLSLAYRYWEDFQHFLPKLVIAIIVLFIAYFVSRKFAKLVRKRLTIRLDDLLLANFIARITKWFIFLVGFVITMDVLGLANFASGLVAGAGVSAIIIGLAFKEIGENFLSGVILAFNRPFNIGDTISSENITGTITSLDLRTTTIKTFEGFDVFVPNSMIVNNPLVNYHREGIRRFDFSVGIDYSVDVQVARGVIIKVLEGVDEVLNDPSPLVVVNELTPNSTNLKIYYWINALTAERNFLEIKSEIIELTVKGFKENGVKIPYDSIQVQFGKGFPEVPVNLINDNKRV